MNTPRHSSVELAGYVTLVACLGIVQFTIFGANLIVVPGVLWLIAAIREGRRPDVPAFFWPLLVLAGWTLLSCAFSLDPAASFERSRQLGLFLVVPMTARFLRGSRAMTTINVIIALGAASAMFGIVEYAALGYDDINHRPKGTLGHYMTYSGLLMLVTCAAASRLINFRREWIWPAIAMPALLVALAFTESRNAWVGTAVAVAVLLSFRQVKLLIALPAAAVLFFLAAPGIVQHRAFSMFDLHDATNRDRVSMFKSGLAMVRDRPIFGVGLNMVPCAYPQYRTPEAVDPPASGGVDPMLERCPPAMGVARPGVATRAHLHNVPIQLAAERGLPALLIWLWFVVVAGRDLFRQLYRGPARAVAGAGAAALVAMVVAGLFEHNFGDSEFLTLFLGLITLPYAAAAERDAGSAERPVFRPAESRPA